MCGIAGLNDARLAGAPNRLVGAARAMARALAHRGPDGEGVWTDPEVGIAFAHRRLAVIDLTPTGAQPMHSADGRWVVVYNGELYNTADLRSELRATGVRFRGTSDTETMLEAVAHWGLERTLAALNGMFAAAFYDRRERVLHLVRDRLGIKPLYWTASGSRVAFASELSALLAVAEEPLALDRDAIDALTTFGCILGVRSIWQGVSKVAPGTIITVAPGQAPRVSVYWSLADVAARGAAEPLAGDDEEIVETWSALLADAVQRQMVSEVPLGAFLSGGLDSTLVLALMQSAGARPVQSFTIGFTDRELDETRHAAAVAHHIGAEHTTLMATDADALAFVPRLAEIYDEPFADSSQIPTALLSAVARKHVKVAVSGDGGDEVFAGYNRHRFAAGMGRVFAGWPPALRGLAGAMVASRPTAILAQAASALVPGRMPASIGDKLRKMGDALGHDEMAAYCQLFSQQRDVARARREPVFAIPDALAAKLDALARMQYRDTISYLPDDILTKVDRAAMAVGLEVRVPLLDHRVVELAWRLPSRMRIRNGQTKWVLRQVLERYVPRRLWTRPKQGFAVPLASWLRGPLREWAHSLLTEPDFGGGCIDPSPVRRLWHDHIGGREDNAYAIWPFLMFEDWRRRRHRVGRAIGAPAESAVAH